MLETRLRELGARFEKAANFKPKVVADGRLITGQNPASGSMLAASILAALEAARAAA